MGRTIPSQIFPFVFFDFLKKFFFWNQPLIGAEQLLLLFICVAFHLNEDVRKQLPHASFTRSTQAIPVCAMIGCSHSKLFGFAHIVLFTHFFKNIYYTIKMIFFPLLNKVWALHQVAGNVAQFLLFGSGKSKGFKKMHIFQEGRERSRCTD